MEGTTFIDHTPVWDALVARARVASGERGIGSDDDFPSNEALIAFMNSLSDDHFDCLLALCYLWEGPTLETYEVEGKPEIMN